jgi:hypothetical protein
MFPWVVSTYLEMSFLMRTFSPFQNYIQMRRLYFDMKFSFFPHILLPLLILGMNMWLILQLMVLLLIKILEKIMLHRAYRWLQMASAPNSRLILQQAWPQDYYVKLTFPPRQAPRAWYSRLSTKL